MRREIIRQITHTIETEYSVANSIGDERESRVEEALSQMQQQQKIVAFIHVGKTSYTNVFNGIDFQVIVIKDSRRAVVPLSVTGPEQVARHERNSPSIPIIIVNDETTNEAIKTMIAAVIKKYVPPKYRSVRPVRASMSNRRLALQ